MSNDSEEKKLLELGRDLSEQLLRQVDHQDREALLQARRQALQGAAPATRKSAQGRNWLPAAVVAGIAFLSIVLISQLWNGNPLHNGYDERGAFLANNIMEDDAPWNENLDMLQNMDFTLWLDMAGPENAG